MCLCWQWEVYFFEFLATLPNLGTKFCLSLLHFHAPASLHNLFTFTYSQKHLPVSYSRTLSPLPKAHLYASSYPFTPEFPSPLFVLMHGQPSGTKNLLVLRVKVRSYLVLMSTFSHLEEIYSPLSVKLSSRFPRCHLDTPINILLIPLHRYEPQDWQQKKWSRNASDSVSYSGRKLSTNFQRVVFHPS